MMWAIAYFTVSGILFLLFLTKVLLALAYIWLCNVTALADILALDSKHTPAPSDGVPHHLPGSPPDTHLWTLMELPLWLLL